MNDTQELGRRLRKARESRGFSQEKVAGEIGVPRTAISHIEHGTRSIAVHELTMLAQLYLRPTLDFLREDVPASEEPLEALFQAAPVLGKRQRHREEAGRFVNICRMASGIEGLLEGSPLSRPPAYGPDTPRNKTDAVGQGEEIAQEERGRLKIGQSPVSNLPRMILSQGIWASELKMPASVRGLFLPHYAVGLAVAVNSSLDGHMQRQVLAEQYAHAITDRDAGPRLSCADDSSDLVALRARSFAAAFLMPKDAVVQMLARSQLERLGQKNRFLFEGRDAGEHATQFRAGSSRKELTYIDVAMLGRHFGVSYDAALLRMANMGLVPKKQMEHLSYLENRGKELVGLLGDGPRRKKNGPTIDREFCFHVLSLGFEAYVREIISRSRLIEYGRILGFDDMTVMVLANASQLH